MRARLLALAAVGAGVVAAVLLPAAPASAHPLGNFSVNQLDAFDLAPDRVAATATVDIAELPTLQEKPAVDADGDGSATAAERSAYARTTCGALAKDLAVTVGGHRLGWTVGATTFEYVPGAAGLDTSRLTCQLSAPAELRSAATVDVANTYRADRIGWREMTAVGHGVRLVDSPIPATSVSDNLRAYPKDLLTSPLDVRTAHLTTRPGDGPSTVAAGASASTAEPGGLAGWTARADRLLERMVGGHLTPLVGMLAVLLAIVLGAGHAALPGHGKTVMAVYLTGRAGRPRDALAVAGTVTATHTGGVLALGLLLTTAASLAGEAVLGWLGVVSGATVAAVGIGMLFGARRHLLRRATPHEHPHPHEHRHEAEHPHQAEHPHDDERAAVHVHDHEAAHAHDHGHAEDAGHGHRHGLSDDRHDHRHEHSHGHGGGHRHAGTRDGGPGRLSIVGMGVAGGLVPSPSALVILLGAIGLGRTAFGVLLVVCYGLGMAGTLTGVGLALVVLRRRWAGRLTRVGRRFARVSRLAPAGTAALVLLVGVGLAGRALAGLV